MEEQTDAQGTESGRRIKDWQEKLVESCCVRHPEAIRDEEIARRFVELHEQVKRQEVQIQDLKDKLREESLKVAAYCADYETRLNDFNWRDFMEFRNGYWYFRKATDDLYNVYRKLCDYIDVFTKRLAREKSNFERFAAVSDLKAFYPPFLIDGAEALKTLNMLQATLDSYRNPQPDGIGEQETDKMVAEENKRGFRRLIAPNMYYEVTLLDEISKLVSEQSTRDYVPYILLLLNEEALVKRPSWKDLCDQFNGVKGNKTDYYRYLHFSLCGSDILRNTFPRDEIESKRSVIRKILKKCLRRYPAGVPPFLNAEDE